MQGTEIKFDFVKKHFFDYLKLVLRYKYFFFVSVIFGAIVGYLVVKTSKVEYKAQITFLINDAKNNNLNPLAALANQFGGGSFGVNVSDERIVFLITTKRILGQSLLFKLNKNDVTLADKLLDIYDLKSDLKRDSSLNNFKKFVNYKLENLNYQENKVIDLLINKIIKSKDLQFESVKKKSTSLVSQTASGIIIISFKSLDENFSKLFVDAIYENLNSFYTNSITKNLKLNFEMVSQRVDSIKRLMLLKEFETADELDLANKSIKYKALVNAGRLKKDAEILNLFYSELLKNKEIAKFNYEQEKPVFEVIDYPTLPLEEIRKSLIIYVLGTIFLFLFLTFIFTLIVYVKKTKLL